MYRDLGLPNRSADISRGARFRPHLEISSKRFAGTAEPAAQQSRAGRIRRGYI